MDVIPVLQLRQEAREAAEWLQDQEAYSLTSGERCKYTRSRVIVAGIDSQCDMNLMDMVD